MYIHRPPKEIIIQMHNMEGKGGKVKAMFKLA